MGTETQLPRGRIQLFKAAAEGKLQDLESLAAGIDNCLGCRVLRDCMPERREVRGDLRISETVADGSAA